MYSAGIAGGGLRHLKDMQLQKIELSHSPVQAEEYVHLAGLPKLRRVNAFNCRLTDDGLKRLVAAVPRIEGLLIQMNAPLTDAGLKHLEKHPTLNYFECGGDLSGKGLTPALLESLRTIPNLRHLWIENFGSGSWKDEDLKRLIGFDKLESLMGNFKFVTDGGLKTLAQLKALKALDMKGSKVTADGVAAFRAARPDVALTGDFDK